MTTLERYEKALKRIGGAKELLNLPEQVKEILINTQDLEAKTKMLELIADTLNK